MPSTIVRPLAVLAMTAFLFVFISGCSKEEIKAKVLMFRAEEHYSKAYRLKFKKDAKDKRVLFYGKACKDFARAYELDEEVFTLGRIWSAEEACKWVEDWDRADRFTIFEEEYSLAHPTEAEYGDMGTGLIE